MRTFEVWALAGTWKVVWSGAAQTAGEALRCYLRSVNGPWDLVVEDGKTAYVSLDGLTPERRRSVARWAWCYAGQQLRCPFLPIGEAVVVDEKE